MNDGKCRLQRFGCTLIADAGSTIYGPSSPPLIQDGKECSNGSPRLIEEILGVTTRDACWLLCENRMFTDKCK